MTEQGEAKWPALESLRNSHRPSERNWLVDLTLVALNDLEAQVAALTAERGEWRIVHEQLTAAYKAQCEQAEQAQARIEALEAALRALLEVTAEYVAVWRRMEVVEAVARDDWRRGDKPGALLEAVIAVAREALKPS